MIKNFAPTGATTKLCPDDHVTLHRGYLDSIVALLRDPTACRGPGLQQIVDDFESAIDAASAGDAVLTAVGDAADDAFWLDIDKQIYEGWSPVATADIHIRLRLERLNLELLIAERDQNDPDQYLEERELNQLHIKELKLKLLHALQELNAEPAVAVVSSPEAIAELKFAARDARRLRQMR